MTLEHRLDIAPAGLLRLIPPFWGKPRMAALLVIYLEELQAFEDAIWSVIDRLDLDTAPRLVLSWMAGWVGEPSRPADNDALRTLVKARIIANRSDGTLPVLRQICNVLFANPVGMIEATLAITIMVEDLGVSDGPTAARVLDDAAAGTVRVTLLETPPSGAMAFPPAAALPGGSSGIVGVGLWPHAFTPV